MFVYQAFLFLYQLGIRVAALFLPKAALWLNGRKGLLDQIASRLPANEPRIWMHCASLGEFEQGRPVLEALRKEYPSHKIVLTFFSPSGYEIRKDYDGADYVFYLPMDGARNARLFLKAVDPALVLFVKYEFWYYYLAEMKRRKIPALLISAAFREEQAFFKWYGGFFRKILSGFTAFFVQDQRSLELLKSIGITRQLVSTTIHEEHVLDDAVIVGGGGISYSARVQVAGDTRYDRVEEIARAAKNLPNIDEFKGSGKLLIGGSTWPEDEAMLKGMLAHLPADWKMILAPHEIDAAHLKTIEELFKQDAVLLSAWNVRPDAHKRVLIIDNIGMLSSLYRYGEIAFVGGGFNKGGIHNVLEPAAFGLPVMIGPVYQKFVEAVAMVDAGFVFPVAYERAAVAAFDVLLKDDRRAALNTEIKKFMQEHTGAVERILGAIKHHQWLD